MIISLICAMDKNRLIGRENGLPWHLPADFKHFKETTLNKPVIMGRKTFESIGRPLPQRKNIVLSRQDFVADGVVTVAGIDDALEQADGADEVMILGGSNLYSQMIERADRLYITHVDAECEGDAWFPEFDLNDWCIVERQEHQADEKNNYNFSIISYQRKV